MFQAFLSAPELWANSNQPPPPQAFFSIFRWFYLVFGLWAAVASIANLFSGLFLRARRHRVFSMAVAGFNCLHLPLGTLLGVFTLIVLARGSVAAMYDEAANSRA